MKSQDVTRDMVDRWRHEVIELENDSDEEVIASAVNAVTPPDNNSSITPDWLDKVYRKCGMFWISPQQDDSSKPLLEILTPDSIAMFPSHDAYSFGGKSIPVTFKTRGELRAWHIAHRQPLTEVE